MSVRAAPPVQSENLWTETPLVYSSHISDIIGCAAYLKLENLQPSQSFKYRGISRFAQQSKEKHGSSVHLMIASSGNAGLAAAMTARALGVKCTVFLPTDVSVDTQQALRKQGADIVTIGEIYSQTLAALRDAVKKDRNAVLVPSYDSPVLWDGHSSMVTEMQRQLPRQPDAIFCSVGGGGLVGGIMQGCKNVGWDEVPIVALETAGSNCFYNAIAVNTRNFTSKVPGIPSAEVEDSAPYAVEVVDEHNIAIPHMKSLKSRAASLGASSAAPGVVRMAVDRAGGITCASIQDEMAMHTARLFADDHKMLTELACATTLTPGYNRDFLLRILGPKFSALSPEERKEKCLVFVVCGGVKISFEEMREFEEIVAAAQVERHWRVQIDGEEIQVPKQ
ncbi:tryptophan synthase beta subunit-like PLP-dependent enzyme [Suillus clintonianus]|uniref:tryptophan synthase beta subunit-like PLP-dependent enzyme n=1 Tax=Suillus clintonianus TaxID=1904413 RepID=UPI001B870BDC|nr:tryptophan synthase beta subunit-like PLP-dependent enzyme [Suillus clintonianus]KAG2134491.1 tryptophan synthase beta subunit-like PLP-dependent enzyme [Suillus clintonianus]